MAGPPRPPLVLIAVPEETREAVGRLFTGHSIDTLSVADGRSALRALYRYRPDALVLSLRLPGLSPWRVLDRVRDMSDLPVLAVSVTYDADDAVRALQAGADDYLTPCLPEQVLIPLVQARLRRGRYTPAPAELIEDGWLTVDLAAREAVADGHFLGLSALEFDLLKAFAQNPGQALTREVLLDLVWQQPEADTDRVKYAVHRLRVKIARATGQPPPIHAVRSVGYRYKTPGSA
ncbi:response regulator transcription factor [Streptomyces sp. TRM66268-LWL]|uniref:Response regulator transcription factor n=1 Tax=Streptomyces polyasparticus TaxID=2767826 RepID=A0ABR7SN52_9ACTN|nr:response regulator transcription factor [Streptomyces polyasparticus]MBC9716324.1 response regulator transcription factor [Streptomyces polyasparticus]